MTETLPPVEPQWAKLGLRAKNFRSRVNWLGQSRGLGSGCALHFKLSAKLFNLARRDFSLIGTAFLESIIGVERALRIYHKLEWRESDPTNTKTPVRFQALFQRAANDKILPDSIFRDPLNLPQDLLQLASCQSSSHAVLLAEIIPLLRNRYLHEIPLSMVEFFPLALDLRCVADALTAVPFGEMSQTSHHAPVTIFPSPQSRR